MMAQLFDVVLVLTIVWLAWRSLADRDLFRAVLKFIALGLLLAVAWVRLRAPDVALAEAVVGSALTGALILSALARMQRHEAAAAKTTSEAQP
jgi:energy-converting hydrogenase B subunit D